MERKTISGISLSTYLLDILLAKNWLSLFCSKQWILVGMILPLKHWLSQTLESSHTAHCMNNYNYTPSYTSVFQVTLLASHPVTFYKPVRDQGHQWIKLGRSRYHYFQWIFHLPGPSFPGPGDPLAPLPFLLGRSVSSLVRAQAIAAAVSRTSWAEAVPDPRRACCNWTSVKARCRCRSRAVPLGDGEEELPREQRCELKCRAVTRHIMKA